MPVDLSNSAVAPPRSARGQTAAVKRVSGKLAERREAVDGIFQLAGFGCIMMRQYADAGAIGMHSPPVATELVALSEKNESIARALDYLTEAGPYAGLIVAVMPLVLQIAANHGIVKAELVGGAGIVPPAALESQVKADMARQAAEALREQQRAEQELAALAAELTPPGPQGPSQGDTGASNGKARQRAGAERP